MSYYLHKPNQKGIFVSQAGESAPSTLPIVTTQPQSITAADGASISFSITAENYVSVYWQESSCEPDPCWYDADFLPNWQTETLGNWRATLAQSGFQYRAVLTGTNGDIVYSEAGVLTVTPTRER